MSEALKRAIEGGWDTSPRYLELKTKMNTVRLPTAREMIAYQEIANEYINTIALLDPLWWQALGKAEGRTQVCDDCGEGYRQVRDNCQCGMTYPPLTSWWEYAWHRFIDHIASGGDIDTFFTNLLSQRE